MRKGGPTTFAEYLLPSWSTVTQFNFLHPDPSSQRVTWMDSMKRLPYLTRWFPVNQRGGVHQQKRGGKKRREADRIHPRARYPFPQSPLSLKILVTLPSCSFKTQIFAFLPGVSLCPSRTFETCSFLQSFSNHKTWGCHVFPCRTLPPAPLSLHRVWKKTRGLI